MNWPEANIGLPCGRDNGIYVVEIDTTNGHEANGFIALAALETKHGKLPDTLQAISPSGSLHYYFNYPDHNIQIYNSTSKIGQGIDVRGQGGMVVVPPSRKGDKFYTWHNIVPIADAPTWLIDLITYKEHPPYKELPQYTGHQPASLDKVLQALINISPDCDYDTWFKVLCALHHEYGDIGFHLAEKWSQGSSNKYKANHFRQQWKSITQHQSKRPITIGTLFHLAKENN